MTLPRRLQRAVLEGRDPRLERSTGGGWTVCEPTEEGQERLRKKRKEALARYEWLNRLVREVG